VSLHVELPVRRLLEGVPISRRGMLISWGVLKGIEKQHGANQTIRDGMGTCGVHYTSLHGLNRHGSI
jgi:hypothetical protein